MKKLNNKAGFTLMEMLVSIFVLVLLVMGIGTSMDSGLKVYRESMLYSDSGNLVGTINASLEDLLRYADEVKQSSTVGVVFTNTEYGVVDAYFYTGDAYDSVGTLQLQYNNGTLDLFSEGSYPNLKIANFHITYAEAGNYFDVNYDVLGAIDNKEVRSVRTIIRRLNS